MATYETTSVFTPTSPARLTFVEREGINEQLVDALRTPGKQIAVYGPSGSGKTTLLLNKLEQIYEFHITTRCTSSSTFESILLAGFDELNPFYVSQMSGTTKQHTSMSVASEYMGLKAGIEREKTQEDTTTFTRRLEPLLNAQRLAEFLGEARGCWVIEDFARVPDEEKHRISEAMKVFLDMADKYKEVKIIVIGAADTAREVIQYDSNMRNRVAEVQVPLMSEEQIEQIMRRGEQLLNLNINDLQKKEIAHYSSGLASVCHQLCLYMCQSANLNETGASTFSIQEEHLDKAIFRYLQDSSDTLKSVFDKALKQKKHSKYDNCEIILKALSEHETEGASHVRLYEHIKLQHPDYPRSNVGKYLKELHDTERGSVIRYDSNSGRYAFSDPLYRAYALLRFDSDSSAEDNLMTQIIGRLAEIDKQLRKVPQ